MIDEQQALEDHIIWTLRSKGPVLTTKEIINLLRKTPKNYDETTIKSTLETLDENDILTQRRLDAASVWAGTTTNP